MSQSRLEWSQKIAAVALVIVCVAMFCWTSSAIHCRHVCRQHTAHDDDIVHTQHARKRSWEFFAEIFNSRRYDNCSTFYLCDAFFTCLKWNFSFKKIILLLALPPLAGKKGRSVVGHARDLFTTRGINTLLLWTIVFTWFSVLAMGLVHTEHKSFTFYWTRYSMLLFMKNRSKAYKYTKDTHSRSLYSSAETFGGLFFFTRSNHHQITLSPLFGCAQVEEQIHVSFSLLHLFLYFLTIASSRHCKYPFIHIALPCVSRNLLDDVVFFFREISQILPAYLRHSSFFFSISLWL